MTLSFNPIIVPLIHVINHGIHLSIMYSISLVHHIILGYY